MGMAWLSACCSCTVGPPDNTVVAGEALAAKAGRVASARAVVASASAVAGARHRAEWWLAGGLRVMAGSFLCGRVMVWFRPVDVCGLGRAGGPGWPGLRAWGVGMAGGGGRGAACTGVVRAGAGLRGCAAGCWRVAVRSRHLAGRYPVCVVS